MFLPAMMPSQYFEAYNGDSKNKATSMSSKSDSEEESETDDDNDEEESESETASDTEAEDCGAESESAESQGTEVNGEEIERVHLKECVQESHNRYPNGRQVSKTQTNENDNNDEEGSCQCPKPEPGFPRWWKKVELSPSERKTVKKEKEKEKGKEKEEEEKPPKEYIKLKCRGPNHFAGGPCVCPWETELRDKENTDGRHNDYFAYREAREKQTPFAFLRNNPPGNFPGQVGDAVHLLVKDTHKGEYSCRLADGSDRTASIPFEYLDVMVDTDNKEGP